MEDTRFTMVSGYGNTVEELEAEALKKARERFGQGPKLAVDRSYELLEVTLHDPLPAPPGMTLRARMRVNVINGINPAYPSTRRWCRLFGCK
jgi:hypothetical protein